MALDFVTRVAAQLAHQRVQDAQHVEVVAVLGAGPLDGLDDRLAGVLDGLHRVGDDEGAHRRTQDDDQLVGVPDHGHVPARS